MTKFTLEYIETPSNQASEAACYLGLKALVGEQEQEIKIPTTRDRVKAFRPYLGREFGLTLTFALDTNGLLPVEKDGTYVEGVHHKNKISP
jgi:hypothetical protein